MQRRVFFASAAMASSSMSIAQTGNSKPSILELRYFRCRNTADNQRGGLQTFLSQAALPALKRAGAQNAGLFSAAIAPDSPYFLLVAQHASISAFEQAWDRLMFDESLSEPVAKLMGSVRIPFERMEVQLLRGFPRFPAIETPPPPAEGKPARIFEMRVYESNTPMSLAKKIGMFENGEIDVFRKTGLNPVFFGETIVGPKMPNLTYMLWHESLAAREANWRNFVTHPEWKKLAATPGLSDGEVVSNISTTLLSPVAGSPVR